MKCKNCGAHYKTRELQCPYCNTENLIGKLWMVQRSEAELEYERARKELGKKASPYVINRILNRTILIILAVFIVIMAGAVVVSFGYEKVMEWNRSWNREEITRQLESYYEAGEYERMYQYIQEKDLSGEDYYDYIQAGLLNYDYNSYLGHKYAYMEMSEEEKWEDDYDLEYALKDSASVYIVDCGIYSDRTEKNQELYAQYQNEIKSFWVGILHLTDEEIELITDEDFYWPTDETQELIDAIKERSICYDNKSE